MVTSPILLYSTITRLAFDIAQRYYGGVHYVWCAPKRDLGLHSFQNPPSSDPLTIYWRFFEDAAGHDRHSSNIEMNKRGLLKGAAERHKQSLISDRQREIVEEIINFAELTYFMPLLVVMPFDLVKDLIAAVPSIRKASVSSEEYIIENLPRACFDVLELKPVKS